MRNSTYKLLNQAKMMLNRADQSLGVFVISQPSHQFKPLIDLSKLYKSKSDAIRKEATLTIGNCNHILSGFESTIEQLDDSSKGLHQANQIIPSVKESVDSLKAIKQALQDISDMKSSRPTPRKKKINLIFKKINDLSKAINRLGSNIVEPLSVEATALSRASVEQLKVIQRQLVNDNRQYGQQVRAEIKQQKTGPLTEEEKNSLINHIYKLVEKEIRSESDYQNLNNILIILGTDDEKNRNLVCSFVVYLAKYLDKELKHLKKISDIISGHLLGKKGFTLYGLRDKATDKHIFSILYDKYLACKNIDILNLIGHIFYRGSVKEVSEIFQLATEKSGLALLSTLTLYSKNTVQERFAFDLIKILLKAKSSKKGHAGKSNLVYAVELGNADAIQYLVETVPDIDIESACSNGVTPLEVAIQYGDREIVTLLEQNGATISPQRRILFDAFNAIRNNEHEKFESLLSELDPMLINDVDADNFTLLHRAVLLKENTLPYCQNLFKYDELDPNIKAHLFKLSGGRVRIVGGGYQDQYTSTTSPLSYVIHNVEQDKEALVRLWHRSAALDRSSLTSLVDYFSDKPGDNVENTVLQLADRYPEDKEWIERRFRMNRAEKGLGVADQDISEVGSLSENFLYALKCLHQKEIATLKKIDLKHCINSQTHSGKTLLNVALANLTGTDLYNAIDFLISIGADFNTLVDGNSFLKDVIQRNSITDNTKSRLVELLISKGADPSVSSENRRSETLIHVAMRELSDEKAIIDTLISLKTNQVTPNYIRNAINTYYDGHTPMTFLCTCSKTRTMVKLAKLLVDFGADINLGYKRKQDALPIHFAIENNAKDLILFFESLEAPSQSQRLSVAMGHSW